MITMEDLLIQIEETGWKLDVCRHRQDGMILWSFKNEDGENGPVSAVAETHPTCLRRCLKKIEAHNTVNLSKSRLQKRIKKICVLDDGDSTHIEELKIVLNSGFWPDISNEFRSDPDHAVSSILTIIEAGLEFSEMTPGQVKFVNGFIRSYRLWKQSRAA